MENDVDFQDEERSQMLSVTVADICAVPSESAGGMLQIQLSRHFLADKSS